MERVGAVIVDILERAGTRYLRGSEPELYRAYLLNIGATDAVRRYDCSETYWDRVQLILDGFFSARVRAQICGEVITHGELRARPEFRGFLTRALAERRLQSVLGPAMIAPADRRATRAAMARRAR